MKRRQILSAAVVLAALTLASTASATGNTGRLAGATEITFGCPGPIRIGGPSCNPWHPFANARFAVDRSGSQPQRRIVVSDAQGLFELRLAPGWYAVTPLPQGNTRGGEVLDVRIRAGSTTRVVVRFQGFPLMA